MSKPAGKKSKKVVDPTFAHARKDYFNVIKTIEAGGQCPFCPFHFKYHKNPILKKHKGWLISKSSWPYENSQLHLIIIGDEHKEQIWELGEEDIKSILFLIKWAAKKFDIKGGGFAMRFGETQYTGATVCHLHAHLIFPKKKKTVNFPIG